MSDDWYKFASLNHFWIKGRFRALTRGNQSEWMANKRFLEIGAGNGISMQQFETLPGVEIDGCDLNIFALEQSVPVKGQLYCLDVRKPPSRMLEAYDGIILLDVLEHLEDDSAFLGNCLKFVKPGGLVVIHVPALNSLFSKYDQEVGHFRRYTTFSLKRLIISQQIKPLKISYWGFSMLPIAWVRKWVMNYSKQENIIKTGFQPPSKGINTAFDFLLRFENFLTGSPWKGTSIYAIGIKK